MPSVHLHKKRGQYYAVLYDPARQPVRIWRTLRTTDQRVARQRLTELEREVSRGDRDPWIEEAAQFGTTLHEAIREYQLDRRAKERAISQRTKNSRFRRVMKHFPERTLLVAVEAHHIERFLASLRGRDGSSPAMPATRENYFGSLFGFFSWCVTRGYLRHHPMRPEGRRKGVSKAEVPDSAFHVFSVDELEALAGAVTSDVESSYRKRLRAYMVDVIDLYVATGLRLSEGVSLTWGQVRLTTIGGRPVAQITVTSHHRGRTFTTKTGARRTVTSFPRAAAALHRMRERFVERHRRPPRPDEVVLRSAWDKPAIDQTITKLFGEYVKAIGLEGRANFHDLRHTYISWALNEMSMPLPIVQQQAGHADVKRTIAYLRVSDANVSEAIARAYVSAGMLAPPGDESTGFLQVARYLAGDVSTHSLQIRSEPAPISSKQRMANRPSRPRNG
jgi:integrase